MEIIFLGENNFSPNSSRRIVSVAIRFDNYNETCLLDCGESTQHYLLRSSLKSKHITKIIISELSADSCLGIIGLLATFSLNERSIPLHIYAPDKFCRYLRLFSRYSQTNFSYGVNIHSVYLGIVCQFSDYRIIACPTSRFSDNFGYSIVEKEKLGKFKINMAIQLKIPFGPIYGKLKKKQFFVNKWIRT